MADDILFDAGLFIGALLKTMLVTPQQHWFMALVAS